MHLLKLSRILVVLLVALVSSLGCSGGGGDDGDDASETSDTSLTPGAVAERGATQCGVVNDGEYENPPTFADLEVVQVTSVLDSNVIRILTNDGEKLIKLHILGSTTGFTNTAAQSLVNSMASTDILYFVPVGCTTETAFGEAEVGQLVTVEGKSVAESLLLANVAGVIESSGDCDSSAIASCFTQISATTEVKEDTGSSTAQQVSDFLWKPNSESGYNPGGVSILLNPCDVRVVVNGTDWVEYPSGNGRCTTVRNGKPGCEFGSNVKVEVFEKSSGNPVYFGSNPFITIDNGCDRTEYAGVDSGSSPVVEACSTAPATVSYRPAYEACGGNAAVLLSGDFADAFSVQLRLPDGSDRLDENCADAGCSPYKVQAYLDESGVKVACFGAPGTANLMKNVQHLSIKMSGDDSDPDRFCITDSSVSVN